MNATAVASIGAIQATCSFHSMAKLCQSAVFGLASRCHFGPHEAASCLAPSQTSVAPARYHGYTMKLPVMSDEPRDHRHPPRADLQPAHALGDPGPRQQLGTQAVQAGKAAGKRQQEQGPEEHPVDQSPKLTTGEPHRTSLIAR